jgi:hypothetical protein
MNDIESIKNERTQIMHDVLDNKIPKRVPMQISLGLTVVADYAGIDRKEAYWNPQILEAAATELCERIPSDISLYGHSVYMPASSQALGSKNRQISSTGYIQHPNTLALYPEEYDEFIEDAYATIIEKCVPRIYSNLDFVNNPVRSMFALVQEQLIGQKMAAKFMPMMMRLNKKFGYPDREMNGGGGRVPFDWVADQLRSFDGICIDVRRHRQQVIDAMEAIYPLCLKRALPPDLENINRHAIGMFQLHMGTYLREKDFAEIWFPTWKRMLYDGASYGQRCGAFLEENYTHLLDYILELPAGSYFTFEYGDPKVFKEKLGKKFVLGGGFPLKYVTSCTKSEVIDKTKEWLDIMAPGGQYIFGFDKSALVLHDVNIENLIAIAETVRDYGVYDNPGTPTGEVFRQEDYTYSNPPEFKSKHYLTWDQYKDQNPNTPESAKSIVMEAEDFIFNQMFNITC